MASSLEIARRAGVSQSTVSRVFTPGASVSAKLRAKVMSVAAELDYRPNMLARSLVTGRSHVIGLIVAYLDNQYYPVVLERLCAAFQARGYHVMVIIAPQTDSDLEGPLAEMLDHQVDGIVMASAALSSTLAHRCLERGVPVVQLNRLQDDPSVSAVTSDNVLGGRILARFLATGGHRRIGYIAGWAGASTQRDREAGFRQGLAEAGLSLCAHESGHYSFEGAQVAARRMFGPRPGRPDAVFVANDHMTIAAMDVLRFELGLRVPQDVSVVSYDDAPQAAWPSYGLTVIRQPTEAMVTAVADILTAHIDQGAAPRRVVLPGRLVVRSSARIPEGWPEDET